MPPKPDSTAKTKPDKKVGSLVCGFRTPGPKYELRTLVGFRKHCLSKYRNPAYSFGGRSSIVTQCEGPGPKYLLPQPKHEGFSFGLLGKSFATSCGPGPKYALKNPKTLAFTLKSRTNHRNRYVSPGPRYDTRLPIPGPAFSIGQQLRPLKCDPVPGPHPYTDHAVRLRAPMYTLSYRGELKGMCQSPGPKYAVKPEKPHPIYSFGTKHSECAPPYIVECDDQC